MATYYELLGVDVTAEREHIWHAYLERVRPAMDAGDDGRVAELDDAWETLRDPVRRSLYDRSLGLAPGEVEPEDPRTDLIELLGALAETGRLPGERLTTAPSGAPEAAVGPAPEVSGPTVEQAEPSDSEQTIPPAAPSPPAGPAPPPIDEPVVVGRTSAAATARPPSPRGAAGRDDHRMRALRARVATGLLLVAAMAAGVVAGLALREEPAQIGLDEGVCVDLTETTATAVPCGTQANGQIVEVRESPEGCAAYPLGYVELADGRHGCVGPVAQQTSG